MRRSILLLAFVPLMLTFLFLTPGRQAHAASLVAACSGSNCTGKDPYGEHCNTGTYYVVQSVPLLASDGSGRSGGYLQLWWSDTCQTNWARVVVYGSTNAFQILASAWTPGTKEQSTNCYIGSGCVSSGVNWVWWSPMVYAPNNTPACVSGVARVSLGLGYSNIIFQSNKC